MYVRFCGEVGQSAIASCLDLRPLTGRAQSAVHAATVEIQLSLLVLRRLAPVMGEHRQPGREVLAMVVLVPFGDGAVQLAPLREQH